MYKRKTETKIFPTFSLVREAMEELKEGVKVGGKLVKALRFADDQAKVANNHLGLHTIMDRLNTNSAEYEMKINIKYKGYED